ncbi:MAG: CoA transferase subunit A [Eubacteriales bacterium]|nr:CoA transferase subunit A [Eubacteriales bacterium]
MKRKNKIMEIDAAMEAVKDGHTIMVGGFGLRGCPDELIDALIETNRKDLTIISNDLGAPNEGLGRLLTNGQIKALIGNYYNWNTDVADAYNAGKIEVTLLPQGTFAESIRAAGVGVPAYYTLASAGTQLGEGKETKEFNGKTYVLEHALHADIALIKAYKSDGLGNLVYCKVARNFNPVMAMAAKHTIAQVSEIVEIGELNPECVVTPHIFVHAVVKGGN